MGPPSHPPDSQTVRGLGTARLTAFYPRLTRHCDQGTFCTMVTRPAGQWLSQLSTPPRPRAGEKRRWKGHNGSPAYSSWPLASRKSLRRRGFFRALKVIHACLFISTCPVVCSVVKL